MTTTARTATPILTIVTLLLVTVSLSSSSSWVDYCECFTPVSSSSSRRSSPRASSSSSSSSSSLSFAPVVPEQAQAVVDIVESSWAAAQSAESPVEAVVPLLPVAGGAVAASQVIPPVLSNIRVAVKSILQTITPKRETTTTTTGSRGYVTYPEGQPATYEMLDTVVPFEFGLPSVVRPLLKQTQLENRPLKVVYDANKHGYDTATFHSKVDGKGASVVLLKVAGTWCGGYNPRGWASLGSPRSSVAAFLFTQKGPLGLGGWQKVRASRTGSMACGNDLFDGGIQFGADSLVIPLRPPNKRLVTSRLGQYFERIPGSGRSTIMPSAGRDFQIQELYILTGVYADGEDIPNSGGVLELGQF